MAQPEPERGKSKTAVALLALCALLSWSVLVKQRRYFGRSTLASDIAAKGWAGRGGGGASGGATGAGETGSEFRAGDGAYRGAREWHAYWAHVRGKDTHSDIAHVHDAFVTRAVDSAADDALRHIDEMRERYRSVDALPDYYARGLGWIEDRLGLVLTVVIAGNSTTMSPVDNTNNNTTMHAGPASVFVVDVVGTTKCGRGADDWIDRQPPLTMWVRANGPEIFAGTALPHKWNDGRCAWRYDFAPRRPGEYKVHVKVLNYNGFADTLAGDCQTEAIPSRGEQYDGQKRNDSVPGDLEKLEAMNAKAVKELAERGNYLHHRGVSGFKMYGNIDACCEACTRARGCKMWSVPGANHFDNCELFFDRVEDDIDFLDRDTGRYLGRNRSYSYMRQEPGDFPDVRRTRRRLAISADELKKPWPITDRPSKGTPRVEAGTAAYFIGCGWSSLMSFESPCHYPSDDVVFGSGQPFTVVSDSEKSLPKASRLCTLDDERFGASNARWVRHPYPDDSECLPLTQETDIGGFRGFMPMYHGDRPAHCWHRDDLTKRSNSCAEVGCQFVIKHRWMTDLKRESKWYGMWEPYECTYADMGDELIQQCIDRKSISKVELHGHSIKNMLERYVKQKLKNVTLSKAENARPVGLDTLGLSHLVWHSSVDEFRSHLEDGFPDLTGRDREHFVVSGFYFTSEREPHVQVDRSLQYSRLAAEILDPKGYKMINALDASAAFGYDTDAQADGLHIDGAPQKAVVTKFFHHLCRDVLSLDATLLN